MNGIASRTIRESGMGYRLAFGVELPRLREIAAEFRNAEGTTPDDLRRLAVLLWKEEIRECKMLAIMLMPIEEFYPELADMWMETIQPEQAELAQLLSMDLLCHMPQAADKAFLMMADERRVYQLCGFLTLTRLLMRGAQLSPDAEEEFLDQAAATFPTNYLPLRKAIQNALLRYGLQSEEAQQKVDHILET